MTVRGLALALVVGGLGGCASQQMDAGLARMTAQNVQTAIARFGYPQLREGRLDGAVYVWTALSAQSAPTPIGALGDRTGSAPVFAMPSGAGASHDRAPCTIRLCVDASGTIRGGAWDGDVVSCAPFLRAMSR